MPVVKVAADFALGVNRQFTPAGDRDAGKPGEGGVPLQRPVREDAIALLADIMQLQMHRLEPGGDEVDVLAIAIAAPKLVQGVLEIHILGVNLIGLRLGKGLVVLSENI